MSDQHPPPPGPELPRQPEQPPVFHPVPEHLRYATQQPRPEHLPPASRKMAGWALGLAIVPCCFGITTVVGIVLGIIVLVRSRDGRDHGKGMAIAAVIIGPLWIVAGIVGGIVGALDDLTGDADRNESGEIVSPDEMSLLKVRTGDCFTAPGLTDGEPVDSVQAVPCREPHEFEAYADFELPDGDYPGESRMSGSSARRCLDEFRAFVGVSYGDSRLEPYNLYPTSTSWRVFDDHTITCALTRPGHLLTGSAQGSRR